MEEFGRNYMRKIFGIASAQPPTEPKPESTPPEPVEEKRTHVLPLSQILAPSTPPRQVKRDRRDSDISLKSTSTGTEDDDEEKRLHAAGFLLSMASPSDPHYTAEQSRKRQRSRYADTMNMPLSQMVRPAYEFMTTDQGVRYVQNPYCAPHSPPQSPPEILPRPRARPYTRYLPH